MSEWQIDLVSGCCEWCVYVMYEGNAVAASSEAMCAQWASVVVMLFWPGKCIVIIRCNNR